ncbi:MAG: TIGR03085 family metal-binding protein [Microthrixaceae bacterium]|nr:TIGR03085 family metal-binding protein [Microthrixaceae bacterium]
MGDSTPMTVDHARTERIELCETLDGVGPDAATLCDGWNAADLAAHLVIRERRPDAAVGIPWGPLAGYSEKVRRSYAGKPWGELVSLVRTGPPLLSLFAIPGVDRLANTMELFVHHEDLRRPQDQAPRHLDDDFADQLWTIVGRMSKLLLLQGSGRAHPGHRRRPFGGSKGRRADGHRER